MQKTKILLVEDEKNFGIVMRDYLQLNQFEVVLCENGLIGLSKFETDTFDLCIVDVMMPQMDGFTLVEAIRKQNKHVPVIFLTARSMREDQLKGYKVGADDYVVKPFDTEILIFKIHAILKRHQESFIETNSPIVFSSFTFSNELRLLTHQSGKQLKLSPKEAELLFQLLKHQNSVVTKSVLLQKIWKEETYFTGRSMDVYLTKLRKYLEPDKAISIENIHGNGYCLKIN
jgi:two-component system, OmpR family, response regulator